MKSFLKDRNEIYKFKNLIKQKRKRGRRFLDVEKSLRKSFRPKKVFIL